MAVAASEVVKYCRFETEGSTHLGIVTEDEIIQVLEGDLFNSPVPSGKTLQLAEVKLLPPVVPSKIIAVGRNYKSHLGQAEPAEYPGLFAKFPSSMIAHGDNIIVPKDSTNLHYEGEMVIIIGKTAKNVARENAGEYVFGVTIGNDVSERGWQRADLQWFRAKASDTFAPMGPWLATGIDYDNLLLETRVNGEVRQSSSTNLLIFDVPAVISYVSQFVTLLPGDAIYTGTPGTTQAFNPGDKIGISQEAAVALRNRVATEN